MMGDNGLYDDYKDPNRYKGPTLTELKIMYDHAKALLDRAAGSKVMYPQEYSSTLERFNKVKTAYEKAIDKQIDRL